MSEKTTDSFKMSMDEDSNSTGIEKEMEDSRIEKLNLKMTLISVLLPCVVIIILLVAYIDIKKRVIKVHDTGTSSVENLSQGVESKLSTLTKDFKVLNESIGTQFSTTDKTALSIKKNLKKAEKNLLTAQKKIKSLQTDEKKLENTIQKMEASLGAVSGKIESIITETKKNSDLHLSFEKISADITSIKADMSSLSTDSKKIDEHFLAIKNDFTNREQTLSKKLENIERKLLTMERKVIILEKISLLSEEKKKPAKPNQNKPPVSATQKKEKKAASPPVPTQPTPTKPGIINEQDIKE